MEYNLKDRPKGITILAWLYIIGGIVSVVLCLTLPFVMPSVFDELQIVFNAFVISKSKFLTLTFLTLVSAMGLVVGLGLLQGRKWGWWLGIFYHLFDLVNGFIFSIMFALGVVTASDESLYSWELDIVGILLVWYFLRQRVFNYFEFAMHSRFNKFWTLVGLSILTTLLLFGVDFFLMREDSFELDVISRLSH